MPHDYGATADPVTGAGYSVNMYKNIIALAYNANSEFITSAEVTQRINTFKNTTLSHNTTESTITATVNGAQLGTFSLLVNNVSDQIIQHVDNWYAYDDTHVFLDQNGGTYDIQLGASVDLLTHITHLPMRAKLINLSGDGTNLSFTIEGEGHVEVALNQKANNFTITGATKVSNKGNNTVDLHFETFNTHRVKITRSITNGNQVPTVNNVSTAGAANVGQTLVGHYIYTDVDGDTEGSSTYRWLRNGKPINGAISKSYTLASADKDTLITFEVKPKARTGIPFGLAVQSMPIGPIVGTGHNGQTVEVSISSSSDDAEEKISSGKISLSSSDLELSDEGSHSKSQLIGLRFNGLSIPQGATITHAYIQFQIDEKDSKTTRLSIKGERKGNTLTFNSSKNNISNRQQTTAAVSWNPIAWTVIGKADIGQQTPSISTIIQEIVNQSVWATGNSLTIIITGSGERTAKSYDGDSAGAPMLHVEYNL